MLTERKEVFNGIPKNVVWTMPVLCDEKHGIRLLMAERTDERLLTFPGGRIERGETAKDAAIRELEEETGICMKPDLLIPAYLERGWVFNKGDLLNVVAFFVYADEALRDSLPLSKEPNKYSDWRWFTQKELLDATCNGRLPSIVFKDDRWIDTVLEISYIHQHGDQYFRSKIPAWFLRDCEMVRFEAGYQKYRKKVLRG